MFTLESETGKAKNKSAKLSRRASLYNKVRPRPREEGERPPFHARPHGVMGTRYQHPGWSYNKLRRDLNQGRVVLQGILGGGVAPGSSNPDPISDQRKKRRKEKEKKMLFVYQDP